MKTLLLILSFLSSSLYAEIILPPMPGAENDKTLMGIDSNNNGVRDDLEIFVYKEITKDHRLYRAYLNYIESYQDMMKNVGNIPILRKKYIQMNNDFICILSISEMESENASLIIRKIFNTKERKKASRQLDDEHISYSTSIKLLNKNERNLLCR